MSAPGASFPTIRSLATTLGGARWRLLVPVALGAVILTFLSARLLVYVWHDSFYGMDLGETGDALELQQLMGTYGLPALHFLLTFAGAAWVARRIGEWKTHGLLVGLLTTFYSQIIMMVVWPTVTVGQVLAGWGLLALPFERLAEYLALGLAGGFLGSATAWSMLARREALLRASHDIGMANEPHDITEAIGAHLARRDVIGVAIWRATKSESLSQPEFWTPPRASGGWPFGDSLDAEVSPMLARIQHGEHRVISRRELRSEKRAVCKKVRGARRILLAPLAAPGADRVGLLMIVSRRRWGFSRKVVRGYMTIATQAALALENMRLLAEARKVGREIGVLKERNRLAREIHDTLTQGFISIVMNAGAAEAPDAETARRNERISRTARENLSEARRLVRALAPEQLENATLPEALNTLARRFTVESGVKANLVTDGDPIPLPTEIEATLVRASGEALHNVGKHANANRVVLSLSYMGERVVLDVRDDGSGFDPTKVGKRNGSQNTTDDSSGGFGLWGMRARIEEVGGTLGIESKPGEGTTLAVEIPAAPVENPRTGEVRS